MLFAVLIIAVTLTTIIPVREASAANTITQPLVWVSDKHDYAVSGNNVVFRPLGHVCLGGVGSSPGSFKGSGTTISIGDDAKPSDDKVQVPKDTEGQSSAEKREVPACNANAGNIPASYAWVTSFKSGDNFALIINGTGKGGVKNFVDAQYKPVGSAHATYAALYKITGAGGIADQKTINEIKVDPSKEKYIERDNSGDEKGDNTISDDNCPVKDWALRWVACPFTVAATEAILKLETLITEQLVSDVKDIFGTSTAGGAINQSAEGKAYYEAWNAFRVLAIAVIVILGIIMVVSEAIGLGAFDAYTIRKLLPRLLIAAIIIALSWWLLKFAVQFFNNIAVWLAGALSFPFESLMKGNSSAWSIVGNYAAGIALFLALGPWGILSYVGTVFMAFLVAITILIVRKILLILAIVMSPLFIAFYIAPNTKKLGSFWLSGTMGLLVMVVAFTLAVTAGQIFSKVSADKDPFGLIGFVALVAPMFLLPVIFTKVAGSAASLIGFINNKATGGFDRLKNFRKGEMQQRGERAKSGSLFGGGLVRGRAAEKLNAATMRAGVGARGNFGFGKKGREAVEQRSGLLSTQYMKSDQGQAMQFNDDANKLLTFGSQAEARRNAASEFGETFANADGTLNEEAFNKANAAVLANGGYGAARQRAAALALAKTGTGYKDVEQVIKTNARIFSGNRSALAANLATINSIAGENRHDLKIGVGAYIGLGNQAADAVAGVADSSGNVEQGPSARQYRDAVVRAFDDVDMATLGRSDKKISVQNFANALSGHLTDAQAAANNPRASAAESEQARYDLGATVRKVKKFQENSTYAPNANIQAFQQGVIKPDIGERLPGGTTTGPNIIQTVTQQARTNVTNNNITYRETTDATGNKVYVQEVQRGTPTPTSEANRPIAEGYSDFDTMRQMRRDDDLTGASGRTGP